MLKYLFVFVFIGFSVVYYLSPFEDPEIYKIFLPIATFLFAIFTGFFIARQGTRYSKIVSLLTTFDGSASALYRNFGHLGEEVQEKMGEIIKEYYRPIFKHKKWDYNLMHKSFIISKTHKLMDISTEEKKLTDVQRSLLVSSMITLAKMQETRKALLALHQERIPAFQWGLIVFLGLILFVTISAIPASDLLIRAALKAAFATSVLLVIVLLYLFDRLVFFEGTIGENSARDVLNILAGKK